MFLILLLGYVALMTMLAVLLVVQEILTLAADEQAAAQFKNKDGKPVEDGKNFIEKLMGATESTKVEPDELRAKLALTPFPLRTYADNPETRPHLNKIMSHLRESIFGKKIKNP